MSETTPVIEGMFDDEGLIGGGCAACDRRHFPLAGHCPWCGAAGPESVRLATEGRVWSWTAVRTAPPGYDGPLPFGFGVVELPDDGLHVITVLTESDPARIQLGDPVRFTTAAVDQDGGVVSWAFAPVAS